MSAISKLKHSRSNWKAKSSKSGIKVRYLQRENIRIKKERNAYKKDARKTKKLLEQEIKDKTRQVKNKQERIYVALQLFLVARIGFRAVSRVFDVLGDYLGVKKAPCAQTIINWVTRLSLTRIQGSSHLVGSQIHTDRFSNGFIWILDASIGLGSGKILTVLALDVNHHGQNEGAPTLKKVHCIGVSVASTWTGESIADFLQKIIATLGRPVAYLKDGGTDLAKAVRLLSERGLPSATIDDISHVVANLLKHEYYDHSMFKIFISSCGKVSKKLKQTALACLAPPKVSTKARFMNLHRLVKWADLLLKHSPRGGAAKGSILSKLRASLDELPGCRAFIRRFLRDATPLLECQKVLKTNGLNQDSYKECQQLIKTIPASSPVRRGFETWAEEHLKVSKFFDLEKGAGLPISSDCIESLFGIAKQHGTGKIKDANRIALRVPALCGELTREDAKRVLNISVKEQCKIESSLSSLTKQRRQVLPNPGCLDKIKLDEAKQNLELIPRPKKQAKNLINCNISANYKKSNGLLININFQVKPPPKIQII